MKSTVALLAISFALTANLSARSWKQAATGKVNEAELVKFEDGKVHLKLAEQRTLLLWDQWQLVE